MTRLKMAISIGSANGSGRVLLNVGKSFFKQVISGCGFPRIFAEIILSSNGTFSSFLGYEKIGNKPRPSFLCEFNIFAAAETNILKG